MKFTLAILLSTVLMLTAQAASIEGDIKLVYNDSAFGEAGFVKEFGDTVKATTKWYVSDFFGKETINAGLSLKNTGTKPMFFQYYIVFYDKDKKLVGATGQGTFGNKGLSPGEGTMLASCLISLPKDKYKEITSFQAVIYETDIAPKK